MTLLRYVHTVLWSFIGLGRRADFARVTEQAHPGLLIAVAVALAAGFVGLLITLARLAAG